MFWLRNEKIIFQLRALILGSRKYYIFSLLGAQGGSLGVILVRVCESAFETYPNHILYLRKNDQFIYLIEQNFYIFIYCSLILYTLFAVCKQSLVSELNI